MTNSNRTRISLSLYLSIAKYRTKADAHDKMGFEFQYIYLNKCRNIPVPCEDPEGGQGV